MSEIQELSNSPGSYNFFEAIRALERRYNTLPRVGRSKLKQQDIVSLHQNPFFEFPSQNLEDYEYHDKGPDRLGVRFLGYFGPQGALPLATTDEASEWIRGGDESFAAFANLFANRFIQLFFRAWSDTYAVTEADRPEDDNFRYFIGSSIGLGSPVFLNYDDVDDTAKLPFAGLLASQVKSVSRLKMFLQGIFQIDVEIEDHAPSWLTFEIEDRTCIGLRGSHLGADTVLGQRELTVNEKFVLHLKFSKLEQYQRFLPTGDLHKKFFDAVFFYIGHRYDFEAKLLLPAKQAPRMQLGKAALGWTGWLGGNVQADADAMVGDARIQNSERA